MQFLKETRVSLNPTGYSKPYFFLHDYAVPMIVKSNITSSASASTHQVRASHNSMADGRPHRDLRIYRVSSYCTVLQEFETVLADLKRCRDPEMDASNFDNLTVQYICNSINAPCHQQSP